MTTALPATPADGERGHRQRAVIKLRDRLATRGFESESARVEYQQSLVLDGRSFLRGQVSACAERLVGDLKAENQCAVRANGARNRAESKGRGSPAMEDDGAVTLNLPCDVGVRLTEELCNAIDSDLD